MLGDNIDIPCMFQTVPVVPKKFPGQPFDAITTGCLADFSADRNSYTRAICDTGRIDEDKISILYFFSGPGQSDKIGSG